MKHVRMASSLAVVACTALLLLPARAHAVSKYSTSLVPDDAMNAGFSARGSSIQINGHLALKGKLKGAVDGTGTRITGLTYSVEVDLSIPATSTTETIAVPCVLANGNCKFAEDLSMDPGLSGAMTGDAVAVLAVRVKDNNGAVIGRGGFAKE
jgi:hypothetical protein